MYVAYSRLPSTAVLQTYVAASPLRKFAIKLKI